MDALNISLGIIILLVAAMIYLNNKQHTLYASLVTQLTNLAAGNKVPTSIVTHTVNVGGTPSGDSDGNAA